MIRTFDHQDVETFAANSSVPVINALTDDFHPCQLLADMQTWFEHRGDMRGKTACWLGDGNNMCHSYINAAKQLGFHLRIACPEVTSPHRRSCGGWRCGNHRARSKTAVAGAHLLVTDVWASMGQEAEASERNNALKAYQLNRELLDLADDEAITCIAFQHIAAKRSPPT